MSNHVTVAQARARGKRLALGEPPRVSVIIPARNEARNLRHILPYIPDIVDEVILVDGHSTDDTVACARRLLPDVRIVRQEGRGKGDALRCGLAACRGEIVALMDADGSTDPREIPRFVAVLLDGADFAKGSRFLRHGGSADLTRVRRLGNRGLNLLVNALFGTRYTDLCYGYNAFWRDCLATIDIDCTGFEVETLLNLRAPKAGLAVVEVPSYEHTRIHGASNLHAMRDGLRIMRTIWREWWRGAGVVDESRRLAALRRRRHVQAHFAADAAAAEPESAADRPPAGARAGTTSDTQTDATPADAIPPWLAARPDVSVIICTYRDESWSDFTRAVASMRHQSLSPREIVVVVDHNPRLLERVRTALPDVIAVPNAAAPGTSGARNTGVIAAGGELLAFLDDDALADPDWLERLAILCRHPQVLGAGSWIAAEWLAGKPGWFPEEFNWVVGCSYRGLPRKVAPVRNLFGASMCLRREIFDQIGGFRGSLGRVGEHPLGCEDTELCVRAQQVWPEHVFLHEPQALARQIVPASRARWRYFRARCFQEGRSKALMVRLVGGKDGLASERAYLLRTLPLGIARGVLETLRGRDGWGIARAGAIAAGLGFTAAGYLRGRIEFHTRKMRRGAAGEGAQSSADLDGELGADLSLATLALARGEPQYEERILH